MPNNRVLKFETNVPQKLALQTVKGLRVMHGGKWQMLFLTVSGQRVYLPEEAAGAIQRIVRSDEAFFVCKRHGRYDVWLSPETEKARAAEEAPQVAAELKSLGGDADTRGGQVGTDTQRPTPAVSAPILQFPAPTKHEEREPLKPTGTDSLPVPALQPKKAVPITRPAPPGRVPYQDALEHICRTVKRTLAASQIVLGDGPTQDLISTVFIAAQKEKAIDFDFGEAA